MIKTKIKFETIVIDHSFGKMLFKKQTDYNFIFLSQ